MSQVEISRGLVAINVVSSTLTRIVTVCLLLWVNQYLLERLSPEQYAPFPVVIGFVFFLQVFTSGLTGGIARYVTEAYARGDLKRVTVLVSSMMPLTAAGGLIFLILGGLSTWMLGSVLTIHSDQLDEARIMTGLLVGAHALLLFSAPFTVGLHVRQKFIWLNLIALGEQLLRAALLFGLLFGVSTQVLWLVVASVFSSMAAEGVKIVFSRRLIPELRFERAAFHLSTTRELTSFGVWTMLGNLLYRIRTSADVIILNRLGTAADVTAFYVGTIPDRQMDAAVQAASTAIQPALTAMHATDRHESLRRAYLRGNRYYLWIALSAAVPLIVYAEELIRLYVGEAYILAAVVLAVTSARYPLNYATEMLYRIALATAQIRGFFLFRSAASVIQLSTTIVLVGHFEMGVLGAVYSSLAVSVVSQLGFVWPMGLRMVKLSFSRYFRETLLPGYLPAVAAAIAALAVKRVLPPESWLEFAANGIVCLAVYTLAVFVCSRPEDRRDLAKSIERVKVIFRRIRNEDSDS